MGLSVVGCEGGDGGNKPSPEDWDGDGLTNEEEAYLGSNPEAADTDHDGYDDGLEVESNTDPLDGFDHPYAGGWPIADCRHDLEGTGTTPGQVAPQFSLMDQHGDGVRLHDFCDRVVVIASAAEWCQPCQVEATQLKIWYDKHKDAGLMVITLLGEDINHQSPSLEDLQAWSAGFGATHPVLQDTSFSVTQTYVIDNTLPSTHIIGRGGVVLEAGLMTITEDMVLDALAL